jgi:hypothetical protein
MIALFIGYYTYRVFSVDVINSHYHFFNIRAVYPFGIYFITIGIVNEKKYLYKTIKYLLIGCFIAGIMAIMQSLYGNTPMFDETRFYHIGHWGGQMAMIGSIARVMLPTIYTIFIVFISLILFFVIKKSTPLLTSLAFFLLIPIMLSFGRTLWLTTFCCLVFSFILLSAKKIIKISKSFSRLILVGFILAISISILPYISSDLKESVSDRFSSFFSDVEDKSGTFEVRLDFIEEAMDNFKEYIIIGVDPFLMEREELYQLSDVGYIYVLFSIGIIGFVLIILVWISQFILSLKILNEGIKANNDNLKLGGIILFMSVIFLIISQQYLQFSFTSTLAYLIYGLAASTYSIEKKEISNEDSLPIGEEDCKE